ncbi:MAG: cyanoexosortase A [Cyanobacteria bacterium J06607_10]
MYPGMNNKVAAAITVNFSTLRYGLFGVLGGFAGLHLHLTGQLAESDLFSSSLLFWLAALLLLWQNRHERSLHSDWLSLLLGAACLTLVLYKSLHLFEGDFFLRLFPLLTVFGWCLIASGWKHLRFYAKELFLLLFMAIPWEFVYLFDISLITAKFSAFILWILGFDVTRQGVWILLPTGSIEVYNGCSGVRMMFQLLGISWLVLSLVPTSWKQKIGLPLSAIALGFIINGFRVALMAVLVALSYTEAFDYWHVGNGSLIFSAIAVLLFGGVVIKVATAKTAASTRSAIKIHR